MSKAKPRSKAAARPALNPMTKLALDLGPLILFFFANGYRGIYFATGTSWWPRSSPSPSVTR